MVGETDDAVEPLDLGDGIFNGLAGGFVDDVEDFLDRVPRGLGCGPPGKLLGDRVHRLDVALGVAGDDRVADGLKGGAQALLRAKGLLGADAENVMRLPEVGGDLLQQAPDVDTDDEAE